ncbi:hypothetical protein ACIQI8_41965 [Streptomyces sp. NPDC092369]|uniref:hypothetical protein n=1 Tax=Streptomyces sp. NPDC092369 TaxID=3366015 RepID=UPI00381DDD82
MAKRVGYHRGDPKATLVAGAPELIAERRAASLPLAEVARRADVSERRYAVPPLPEPAGAAPSGRGNGELSDACRTAMDTLLQAALPVTGGVGIVDDVPSEAAAIARTLAGTGQAPRPRTHS